MVDQSGVDVIASEPTTKHGQERRQIHNTVRAPPQIERSPHFFLSPEEPDINNCFAPIGFQDHASGRQVASGSLTDSCPSHGRGGGVHDFPPRKAFEDLTVSTFAGKVHRMAKGPCVVTGGWGNQMQEYVRICTIDYHNCLAEIC